MNELSPPRIYEYNDYRVFLRDFFTYQKRAKAYFSQRFLAQRAGFSSHTFLLYVMNGKRNLTNKSAEQLIKGLNLKDKQAGYFRILVKYSQAETTPEKEELFSRLNELRSKSVFFKIHKNQYAYFDHWYYPVIRELAVHFDWHNDHAALARAVAPPITPQEASKALTTLIDIGMISKNDDGRYVQTAAAISAQGLPPHLLRKARNAYIKLALEASDTVPMEQRNISAATMTLTEEAFRKISEAIDNLRDSAVNMPASRDANVRVYQLNFQLFPLSRPFPHAGEKPLSDPAQPAARESTAAEPESFNERY